MLLRQEETGSDSNESKETKDWLGFTHHTQQAAYTQEQLEIDYFSPPTSKKNVSTTYHL